MTKIITNRYAGNCSECGNRVPAGVGVAYKDMAQGRAGERSSWLVRHKSCDGATAQQPQDLSDRNLGMHPRTGEVVDGGAPAGKFPLTDEQRLAVEAFAAGESIAIQALAGTGKTSTLVAIARSTDRVGQYVAFNRAIVQDAAAKMPKNVSAATAHSLAYRQVGKRYKHRLDSARMSSVEIARRLEVGHLPYRLGDLQKVLQPKQIAGHVMNAIKTFCNSADPAPRPGHVGRIDGLDLDGSWENHNLLQEHIAPALERAWADLVREDGELRFSPDVYLKIWQLGLRGAPVIPGDFILFDEAQDASPVLLDAVEQQGKQIVFVGDAQQQIYEWRGAVDAMASVSGENTLALTNSFRFGEDIAGAANTVLGQIESCELRLTGKGKPGAVEAVAQPEAILTRTNAGAITVAMEQQQQDRLVHVVGGGGEVERFAKAARDLKAGGRTDHPELSIFGSWDEVVAYTQQDVLGSELAPMVQLIDKYGVEMVLQAVGSGVAEEDADVVVSTAHKAKGREWDTVQLHADFPVDRMNDSEYRLLYVAVTRARLRLDVRYCAAATELGIGKPAEEEQPQGPSAPGQPAAPRRQVPTAEDVRALHEGNPSATPAQLVQMLRSTGWEADVRLVRTAIGAEQ